jgi:hypothetical protein
MKDKRPNCLWCCGKYTPKRWWQNFCSDQCRFNHHNEKKSKACLIGNPDLSQRRGYFKPKEG